MSVYIENTFHPHSDGLSYYLLYLKEEGTETLKKYPAKHQTAGNRWSQRTDLGFQLQNQRSYPLRSSESWWNKREKYLDGHDQPSAANQM